MYQLQCGAGKREKNCACLLLGGGEGWLDIEMLQGRLIVGCRGDDNSGVGQIPVLQFPS